MSESSESNSEFTPEELAAIDLEIPTFKREPKLAASQKLIQDMDDPGKRGGVYSELDPVNQANLLGFGTPSRPLELSDIKPPTTDTALNAEKIEQLTEVMRGKKQYLSPKKGKRSK